jgi:hypothetical protein
MFSIGFIISLPDDFNQEEDELPQELIMEATSRTYKIKPENKNLYCDYRQLSYRKTKGDAEKIIKALGKFFVRLQQSLQEDIAAGNIHPDNIELVKEKFSCK